MTTPTLPKTARVVLYGRVSSEKQVRESRSVDDQLTGLRKWASREGHTVVAELRDDGISASRYSRKKTRPDWQKAMELITAGLVDLLAVWTISRATRDRAVWAALIAACTENGVKLVVDGKIHDPADPDDGFMLDIQAALAVNGSARISKDVKRSVESRASRGAPHGRVPDGYAIEYDPETGKPVRRVIDPVRGLIIREIVDRLLAGESAYSIAADLNSRGVHTRTGKRWMGANIVRQFKSPTLAGLRVFHGQVLPDVKSEWPPILTVEEFHRLQALFADPKRKLNKEGTSVRYLGTGIYRCGVCGGPMGVNTKYRKDGSVNHRYKCIEKFCVERALPPTDLKVELAVIEFLSRPDVFSELADDALTAEVQAAQEEAARLRAQLVELREKVDSGALGLDDLAYFKAKWEPKLAEVEERARPKHIPTVVFDVAGAEAQARWEATPIHGKRAIVKALVDVKIMSVPPGNRYTPFNPDAIVVTRRSA